MFVVLRNHDFQGNLDNCIGLLAVVLVLHGCLVYVCAGKFVDWPAVTHSTIYTLVLGSINIAVIGAFVVSIAAISTYTRSFSNALPFLNSGAGTAASGALGEFSATYHEGFKLMICTTVCAAMSFVLLHTCNCGHRAGVGWARIAQAAETAQTSSALDHNSGLML